MGRSRQTVLLAFAPGGHATELALALGDLRFRRCVAVTFASGFGYKRSDLPGVDQWEFVTRPSRSIWLLLKCTVESFRIVVRERPALVISTGSRVAVPSVLISKLFGARVVWIETCGSVDGSASGRVVYPFADLFLVQWPEQRRRWRKAQVTDGLLL